MSGSPDDDLRLPAPVVDEPAALLKRGKTKVFLWLWLKLLLLELLLLELLLLELLLLELLLLELLLLELLLRSREGLANAQGHNLQTRNAL